MADYKKMYVRLFQATTKAINLLVKAQQDCEELYLSSEETKLTVFPGNESNKPEQ